MHMHTKVVFLFLVRKEHIPALQPQI